MLASCVRRTGAAAALVVGWLFCAALASAEPPVVYLNEVTVRGSETVELYNSAFAAKNIGGWRVREGAEQFTFPGGTIIPGHGYVTANLAGILDDIGGEIVLIDLQGELQDGVAYGQVGSAPLPPGVAVTAVLTLARAPDASTWVTVPPPNPNTDGSYWTLDPTGTFGTGNDAPIPLLGSTLEINEIHSDPGGGDEVEFYNPTVNTIPLTGWMLCNGVGFQPLSGGVGAHGFFTITTGATFDVDDLDLLYLFDPAGVRRDQLGWTGGPFDPPLVESATLCLGRYHDGQGPNLGYDWDSSGGGTTFLVMGCTLGGPNGGTTGLPDGAPLERSTWGKVKMRVGPSRR